MKTLKYLYNIALACFAVIAFTSCEDADVNRAWGSTTPPAQVSNIRVKNISGGAILYYDRPDDANFYYLKAKYNSEPGIERIANASFYTDSILLVGFAEAGEYDVKLYSISYGEAASEPVVVKVNPTTPPYLLVAEQLTISPTFGGVKIRSLNETGANIALGIMKKGADGQWIDVTTAFTKAINVNYAAREQEPTETEFGVFVRDRWNHKSEMKTAVLTPWSEVECNKNLFKKYTLPNGSEFASDSWVCHQWASTNPPNKPNTLECLWDLMTNTSTQPCFHSKLDAPMPQWFTIDLGANYQLSRLVIHWRTTPTDQRYFFQSGHVRYFELWGSNDPAIGDNFDAPWFKIGDFESTRPSGSTNTSLIDPLTNDEKEMQERGQEFEMPEDAESVRYIRFKSLETWGKMQAIMINELTFFGTEIN